MIDYKYVIIKARKFEQIDFLKMKLIVEKKGNIRSDHVWMLKINIGECLGNASSSNKQQKSTKIGKSNKHEKKKMKFPLHYGESSCYK